MNRRIVLAVTGASGAAYARRLLDVLVRADVEVHWVVSPYGRRLLVEELEIRDPSPEALLGRDADNVVRRGYQDLGSTLASGSFLTHGMVICPCSSNTLGAIAAGLGDNLITRAAHVHLKERRPLILVHREMPLSHIEIANMQRLSEAGATICPAAPGFYLRPKSINDLVDFVVGKVLDLLDVPHELNTRWTGAAAGEKPAERS
ncbi:MAG: flavin prenyltransferase UbiX [Phycisphaerae bacterium]